MARPKKYSEEEARLARLKSKRDYYCRCVNNSFCIILYICQEVKEWIMSRNLKSERKKALQRYHDGKEAGKTRAPSSRSKSCPTRPNDVTKPIEHVQAPLILLNSRTSLKTAIAAIWTRVFPEGEPVDMQQVLEKRFSQLLTQCTDEPWANLRPKIVNEIKHVDNAITESTKIRQEAWKRDPTGNSFIHNKVKRLTRELEAYSGLLFEARVWLDDGGSAKLLHLYDGRQLFWQHRR
ncbi:hypothetical protein M422DRAFT_56134 [Sphaerobolus stellatus SS14]|uniref:Unplaced genomic scaffold SPHSTscaffold_359, whole genome shotgun sequence n=1 Tax=Sphaerobolus stellatus (strain SS14) TaxID=990650 RepID=A0A0C9UIN0_SPHS4|nr:hypothetical protein M422DRAFT_56134 [Sphaerobolus stellatus SS14]